MKHALCCAFVWLALIGPAQAGPDDFDRVISFGDSLSDNGNLSAASLGARPGADYVFGRFSNGPTFVELLAGPVDPSTGESSQQRFWGPGFVLNPAPLTGDINLAVGGAQTQGDFASFPPDVPSVAYQISTYTGLGGTFGTNDLVTILAGANDLLPLIPQVPLGLLTPAQLNAAALDAATAQTGNVDALVRAGARTILVANLPNLGAAPALNNPFTRQPGLDATVTFNTTLDQGLETLAAGNAQANIVQMDLQAAMQVVITDPAAFGFTNVTDKCLVSPGNACANPDQFLFWGDVHPTAAGHALLAQYASALLSTDEHGKDVAALGDTAVATRLDASDILFRRGIAMLGSDARGGVYAEIVGTGADEYQLAGIRAGFDARQYGLTFGGALAHLSGEVDAARLTSDASTTQADLYALYATSAVFVGVEGGLSWTQFDGIRRDTTFPTVIAEGGDTDSTSYSVAATLGTQLKSGGITLTPALRVGYLAADVDAFAETAPLLALGYSGREIEAGFWTARLRASAQLSGDGRSLAYVEAGYEDLFSLEDGYSAKLVDNTAHAVQIDADDPAARGFFVKAGLSAYVSETVELGAEYGVAFQDGDGETHSGRLTLRIPLGGPEHALGGAKD